jgi:hypothetical protein
MTASANSSAAGRAKEARRFFEKQLPGEQPLSFEAADHLYQLASDFLEIEPWNFLEDQDLILQKDPASGEVCYCSILGALGEVFSLQIYIGAESYRLFRRISTGQRITSGEFLGSLLGVSVEFVTAKELTPPDRELLQAFGNRGRRGARAPIFRASRPGYHSWHVTESEARLLIYCLQGTIAFCRNATIRDDPEYWGQEDVFPFVAPNANGTFEIQAVKAPESPRTGPQPVNVDDGLIAEILAKNWPREGSLEADHFFAMAKIGKENERKACLSAAIVCDGVSGFALQADLGMPGEPPEELLVRAILRAIQSAHFMPLEIRVRKQEFGQLLEGLSEKFGFAVHVKKSLAMLDPFKRELLARF